jgi:alpha-aminoadipic semialdehyde synthase
MPLLDALLEKKIRMVDFEGIKNDSGRLVAFGRFAGIAGTFDFLRGCGEYLLQRGFQTPLIFLGSAYMYEDWADMQHALSRVAKGITVGAIKPLGPMVFAVTGTGRVGGGALEVLTKLPHEFVDPGKLEQLVKDEKTPCDRVYLVHLKTQDLFARKDGKDFDKADFYGNP